MEITNYSFRLKGETIVDAKTGEINLKYNPPDTVEYLQDYFVGTREELKIKKVKDWLDFKKRLLPPSINVQAKFRNPGEKNWTNYDENIKG